MGNHMPFKQWDVALEVKDQIWPRIGEGKVGEGEIVLRVETRQLRRSGVHLVNSLPAGLSFAKICPGDKFFCPQDKFLKGQNLHNPKFVLLSVLALMGAPYMLNWLQNATNIGC